MFGLHSIEKEKKKNYEFSCSLDTMKWGLLPSLPLLIPSTKLGQMPPSGFAVEWLMAGPEGSWAAWLSTPLSELQHKSPAACHSIHFPHSSSCPLSYEACEILTTCAICEYIRLSAFALMLLKAGLAWVTERHFFWGEIYNFSACMSYIYSLAS